MKRIYTLTKKIALTFITLLSLHGYAVACDTSGFDMNSIIDNGDGTFTIQWTVLVAGDVTTDVGSTWGFFLNIDADILSISPSSFTSVNGTTLNAVFSGGNVQWGNPVPGSGPVFLDITTQPNDEHFDFTMVVTGIPTEWMGGGQEGNLCPGGGGSVPENYAGEFPCFEPVLTPMPDVVHICPGDEAVLTVVPNHLVEDISWSPGNGTGTTITVMPNSDETYTVTGSNVGCESTTTITVIVDPLPELYPQEEMVQVCEGTPAVLVVGTLFTDVVTWSPGNVTGEVLVVTPTTSPTIYTATGTNICGEDVQEFTVTTLPFPAVTTTPNVLICQGESTQLIANPTGGTVTWNPGGSMGNTLTVSPSATTTYTASVTNFCGTVTSSVTVTVTSNTVNAINLAACAGESVMYNGIPLAAGSNSTFTFTNSAGCDSVVTVHVNSLPNTSGTLALTACQGETVSFMGQNLAPGSSTQFTLTSFNGCDSVLTVNVTGLPNYTSNVTLQACVGETASYAGQNLAPGSVTPFVFNAFNGCDSTVTVTVQTLQNYASSLTLQTCTGTSVSYNGQNLMPNTTTPFTLTAQNGCDSVVTVTVQELAVLTSSLDVETCTGTTFSYNGQQLAPGTTTDFDFTTANGCDSTVTVTVTEVTAFQENLSFDACTGTTVTYNGETLQPGTTTDFNFVSVQGCDSVVTVLVVELQTYASALTLQTCTGIPIMYAGQTLPPNSTTPITLTAANGCDSIVTVTVDEIQVLTSSVDLEACEGSTVFYGGQNLQPGSVTPFTYTSTIGCDSVVTVTVAMLQNYTSSLALQACEGNTASYNGLDLPPGTDLDFTFTAANGCDSVVNVTVTEVQGFQSLLELQTCPGTTATYNGQQLAPGTVTQFDFIAVAGCDSTVTVTVSALPTFASTFTLQACTGSTATYNGQQLQPGSVTPFTLNAQNGCDSVVTVTVMEVDDITSSVTLQACPGSTAPYNGQQLAPGSVTPFTFTTAQGCDSIVTVTVQALQNAASNVTLQACTGSTAPYNGQQLAPGSVTPFTFDTWQGCDSVVTVTVMELLPQSSSLTIQACTGSTATYNGQQLAPGSVTPFTFDTWQGCDSVVTVTVQELDVLTGAVTLQGCAGETLTYNGETIQPGTTADFTFTSVNGCDSIVTVTALSPIPTVSTTEQLEICEGASVLIFGQPTSLPGDYSQTFTGSNGCDSTHTVTLSIVNNVSVSFANDLTIRLGETTVLNPVVLPPTGVTYAWQSDPTLSCLDCPSPTASPTFTTTYSLTVSDQGGCSDSATLTVQVDRSRGVYIPNSFSPNDDGINDVFMIFSDGKSIKQVNSFKVFSRWGESVYEFFNFPPDDIAYGWVGMHRGKRLDNAVFVYYAEIEFLDGEKQLYKGDVTLMK